MSDKMTKQQMEGLIFQFRRMLENMQGHTFYCEDENGVLRRWYPPKPPILSREEDAG